MPGSQPDIGRVGRHWLLGEIHQMHDVLRPRSHSRACGRCRIIAAATADRTCIARGIRAMHPSIAISTDIPRVAGLLLSEESAMCRRTTGGGKAAITGEWNSFRL